jgi:plasmid maintenance system antidote protein VapI
MDTIKNKPDGFEINKNPRVFFALKKQSLMQQVLINTLMIRNNCLLDDLAQILNINAKKLHQVWEGHDRLTAKESTKLIRLFYILTTSMEA